MSKFENRIGGIGNLKKKFINDERVIGFCMNRNRLIYKLAPLVFMVLSILMILRLIKWISTFV